MADARQQIYFGLSIFPQFIANQFLQSEEFPKHLHSLRQELLLIRNEMASALTEILGDKIEFSLPKGGLFRWIKMKGKVDDHKLVEEGIKNKVLFMPGSVYGSPNGYARFTYARMPRNSVKEAVSLFAEALSRL